MVQTDELRAALAGGVIAPNTPVWREGWKEWRPATEVAELASSALSAAHGVVPTIPPPPMAVVAAQHAFEGAPPPTTNGHSEPPPPPAYIPVAVTMPPPAMGLAALVRSGSAPPPTANAKPPPPPTSMNAPPAQRPVPAAMAAVPRVTHVPQVPQAPPSKPPRPASKAPPKVEDASPEVIEELSGSVLLADASGTQPGLEELSGSLLLADATGSVTGVLREKSGSETRAGEKAGSEKSGSIVMPDLSGPAPVIAPKALDEFSGNFLVDAGSTGALPSVESTGRILAAKAASRAPFAPFEPARTTPAPRMPVAVSTPLPAAGAPPPGMTAIRSEGSHADRPLPSFETPPPSPAPVIAAPKGELHLPSQKATLLQFRPQPVPGPQESEPFMVPPPSVAPEQESPPTLVGVPPPPAHLLAEESSELPTLAGNFPAIQGSLEPTVPPMDRSTARLHDFRALGHDPRAPYILAAFGLFGLVAMVGLVGMVVSAFHKKPSEERAATTTAAATTGSATTKAAPLGTSTTASGAAAGSVAGGAATALGAPCTLAGTAHVVAPRAVVQSGVEVASSGSRLAVGFATRDKDGVAVVLDPSSLVATQSTRVHASAPIRRMVPLNGPHGLVATADVDTPGAFLEGRRTVSAEHPFDLGFGGGGLAWAPHRSNEVDLIWTLEGEDPVEAVRATPLDASNEEAGWAIAFRRGASIYAGVVNGGATLTANGSLVKVDGLGPQVGSPTIAAQDGAILVAWADRAQPSEPWSLRWMRFAPGDASAEAKAFVPSEGGLGEHAMSPAIGAAGHGRFLLAWTEGPVSNHQVRAQTITGSGMPLGNAMAISDSGVNAGQAQLAVLPDGHGVVAYLASAGTSPKPAYEVLATPIVCP
jgi:hypothetical protein